LTSYGGRRDSIQKNEYLSYLAAALPRQEQDVCPVNSLRAHVIHTLVGMLKGIPEADDRAARLDRVRRLSSALDDVREGRSPRP
jgi:hypothetical protein